MTEAALRTWPGTADLSAQLGRVPAVAGQPNVRFGVVASDAVMPRVPLHGFMVVDDRAVPRPAAHARSRPPARTTDLRRLGIPRLDAEAALTSERPNIPLNELTGGRVEALLSVVDRWVETVREAVGEPETA